MNKLQIREKEMVERFASQCTKAVSNELTYEDFITIGTLVAVANRLHGDTAILSNKLRAKFVELVRDNKKKKATVVANSNMSLDEFLTSMSPEEIKSLTA